MRLGPGPFSRSARTHRVRWVTAEIRFTSRSLVLLSPHNSVTFCFLFGIPEFSQYGCSQIPDFRALADLGPQSTLHSLREWNGCEACLCLFRRQACRAGGCLSCREARPHCFSLCCPHTDSLKAVSHCCSSSAGREHFVKEAVSPLPLSPGKGKRTILGEVSLGKPSLCFLSLSEVSRLRGTPLKS